MTDQTKKVRDFIKANDINPVVSGAAIGRGGQGAVYTLKNKRTFHLSADECSSLPPGYPKWLVFGEVIPAPASNHKDFG